MKLKRKLAFVFLVIIGVFIGYLIVAKNTNIWPYHKPELLVLEEKLEKKYGQDYKPIYLYIKTDSSDEEIILLKNKLEQYPEVIAVEVVPWPKKSKSEYSAALRLIPMVKRVSGGLEGYPSDVLDFLNEGKTDPSSPTHIISNWSLRGEPNDFFDWPY
ncbi:MAG: hypothetical protein US53_C0052G0003 [Candidatus Woesebacteria bacterium GW2011_GWA1_37_7]|uniref:Uncharacterized protein n=1 Tax=Candidatus Woesebacteria bacterium GW2011_GWA1_37_7 TaxID=1618545 RepID=A0A0G0HD10_9BACT|nr:MAG: hypothetical protein US53_C0052G0003 [Candidatus Woesebacteria bacterium GW2011_GWA1_37_7]